MAEPNNDIDTETLQAQIDLSMAFAQSLVASWLPGSQSTSARSSSRAAEAEAELQALIRRPPRLGVGAPLPESAAPAQTRLIQKLEGKKRSWVPDNATPAKADKEDSEDEESRAGTVRKRARIDPFEPGGKKKKKKKSGVADTAKDTRSAAADTRQEEADESMAVDDAPDAATSKPVPAKPGSKKKKKKKKHLAEDEGAEEAIDDAADGVADPKAMENGTDVVLEPISPEAHRPPEHRKKKKRKKHPHDGQEGALAPSSPVVAVSRPAPLHVAPLSTPSPKVRRSSASTSPVQPSGSPIASASKSGPALLVPTVPVLNLTGPPPVLTDQAEESNPKKRRRKKKKKHANDRATGGDA
ncbi:hypothetical protein BC834DRAFT_843288 [Gloeopeniophorella convolvens]|nr:hypothetical protein BC834DRAFT_843288 [Gloeopeniophorella convolvens]